MSQTISELAEYPVVVTLPIQWGEQDAFGHVNGAVPVRWFETARIAYLLKIGLNALAPSEGIGPILAAVNCNYRSQVKFPDTIHIGARVTKIGNSSLNIAHLVYSEAQQAVTVEGDTILAAFDYQAQKTVRIPDEMRAAIEALESTVK